MPNEEILTGLRNAIEHGESLQEAMQVMINSGYNPAEIQEASKFIGGGILESHISKPEENLMFPEKKSFFPKFNFFNENKDTQTNQQFNSKEINPKKYYTKEIILIVILLILVGVLIATIALKNTLLGWFS